MKTFILALSLLAVTVLPTLAISGATTDKATGPFTLPALTYEYGALAPAIDAKTMETHHARHHQAYIDKLNSEIAKEPKLQDQSLDAIIANISAYNDAVRNNAGGHWNHSFFWTLMAPTGETGALSPALEQAINDEFGSLDQFKAAFEKAGADRFGSGWVWLIADDNGKLAITSTANQDNPLMDDAATKGTPILGNDVWEHAYYLTYQNKRGDYLKNWWSVVNWDQVSENFAAAAP